MPIIVGDDPPEDDGECQLMGPFAILVQVSLAAVAILALLVKRQREHPRRPFQVWFILIHLVKLIVSGVLMSPSK